MTKLAAWARKPVAWAVGALILALAVWWIISALSSGKTAKTEAKLNANQVEAATESGADAVSTVGEQMGNEADTADLTRDNRDAILSAEGADAPVANPARDAGLDSLCKRRAYRDSPKCLQRAPTP